MPRVSVILPNFNYARYLRERIRSILGQTYRDFELIYVDDGSTDDSNRIAEEWSRDPRMRMHIFEKNSGRVYQRWNDGATLATGEWLWFAGADDVAHPRFLEKMLEQCDAHPKVAIAYSQMMMMDSLGRLIRLPITHPRRGSYFSNGRDEIARLVRYGNFIRSASSALLRRQVFEDAGRFDVRLWLAADWDVYLKMLQEHDIVYTSDPLACYRWHPQTVTTSTKTVVRLLEDAYCVTGAVRFMRDSSEFTQDIRDFALHNLRLRVFEMFAGSSATIPDSAAFAARTVYQLVPDERLAGFGPG